MSKEFKAGRYYIGDLRYVISDQAWDNILGITDFFNSEGQILNGYPILARYTGSGDGLFQDQKRRIYGVDSGTFGIMPFKSMEKPIPSNRNYGELGHVIEFRQDFNVECNNGVFTFNNIVIDTN